MLSLLPNTLSGDEALNQLVESNGNIALAAERLHIKPAELIKAIATSMPASEVMNMFRTLLAVNLYQSVLLTGAVYETQLASLDPYDVAKTYTTLLNLLASITQNQVAPVNINLQETVLKLLPPEIRNTVVELVNSNDGNPG